MLLYSVAVFAEFEVVVVVHGCVVCVLGKVVAFGTVDFEVKSS